MNSKFNWQSFISIGLLLSFVVLVISGIVLYIAPEGSLSRWIGWEVLNLTKKQWEHQHTIFSYLFILFSIFHIFKINWFFLVTYFSMEKLKISNLKEILIALVIVVIVFVGTLVDINPFRFVIQTGSEISNSHSENVEIPKISDSEKLSLTDFADKVVEVPYVCIESKLKERGYIQINKDALVIDFCKINRITPETFYKMLK